MPGNHYQRNSNEVLGIQEKQPSPPMEMTAA
jgi:hypothetical protein